MKNIFKDVLELKPILKEIKGDDKMSSLAQRWLDQGIQQGISQGIETGIQQGIFETAIRMIEKFNLSVDDVITELNIKKEDFLEYMKNR